MQSQPKIIIGLGNPERKYDQTRHNIGRALIDYIRGKARATFHQNRLGDWFSLPDFFGAAIAQPVHFYRLHSYMNVSGSVVREICHDQRALPSDLLILVDDFMLPYGTARLRRRGSAGGHNGLQSIIETFHSEDFARLRMGIGPAPAGDDAKDFVLEKFTNAEQQKLEAYFESVKSGLCVLFADGYEKGMSAINKNHL